MRISVFLGTCAAAAIVLPLSTGALAQRGQDSDRGSMSRLDRGGSMGDFRQGKESLERFQGSTVGTRIRQEDPHHPTSDPHHPMTDPHGTRDPHHPATDSHGWTDQHHPATDTHGTTDPHHPTTDPRGTTDPHHTTTDPHHTTPG